MFEISEISQCPKTATFSMIPTHGHDFGPKTWARKFQKSLPVFKTLEILLIFEPSKIVIFSLHDRFCLDFVQDFVWISSGFRLDFVSILSEVCLDLKSNRGRPEIK